LDAFLQLWEQIQPTIASGWNSNGFDFPYLVNRIQVVLGKQASYRLSPIGIVYQNKFNHRMVIAGINLLDYMDLYKKFIGVMKSSWSLGNVAKDEELTHQKLTYRGSLTQLYNEDLARYVEYNLVDVKVVVELDAKYDFIHLACSVCHKGHVPYEWFQMSSRFIDGAILTYLRRHDQIAPNKPIGGREEYDEMKASDDEGFTGAFVKEPISGLYDWICSADIRSLYPSVIMTLNISPETKIGKVDGWDMMAFQRGELPNIRIGEKSYTAADFKKMIADYKFSISSNGVLYKQPTKKIVGKIIKSNI
jgi:DNA polymerase elongation subunit (family B)